MLAESHRSARWVAAVTACAAMTMLVSSYGVPAKRLDPEHTAKVRVLSVERVPTPPALPLAAEAPVVHAAKPAAPNPVTHELPTRARSLLTGCWQDTYDRWTFRSDGKLGLVIVRDPAFSGYAERAKIPRPVMYDPTKGSFAFGCGSFATAES